MMKLIENEWRYFDDKLNIPAPWYVKQVVEILDKMDFNGKRIFEYGVGDSTAWFRSKGAKCYGIETDKGWAEKCGVYNIPIDHQMCEYCSSLFGNQPIFYDLIVIDGEHRDDCLLYAIQAIKKDGLIIIDNFEQPSADLPDWPKTRKLIEEKKLNFTIYKQEGHQDWQTLVILL